LHPVIKEFERLIEETPETHVLPDNAELYPYDPDNAKYHLFLRQPIATVKA
jgi:hypothetical protein